ncbi:DUF3035 domain-containing protein [Pelagibacteraceae bacterium]|nr:DUF3035 domain-containing protein [Pelagibacteraceae bacterium]
MKKINLFVLTFFLIASCGGLSDAGKVLRNEKVSNNDEFLVKKREPLILPPDYNEMPKPGDRSMQKEKSENDDIKKILKSPVEKNIKNRKSTVEQTILNQIRK